MQNITSPEAPAVLMLYGHHGEHPWAEDMFRRPEQLQAAFAAQGFRFDIGMALDKPVPGDIPPQRVLIAQNPHYDEYGEVQEANFRPGSIEDYPVVIDHWVANFQDLVKQPDGGRLRTAYGIGLPPERLWNHKSIQTFGNRKDFMDGVLRSEGVAIDTWNVLDFEELGAVHGDTKVIYKPIDGSRGKDIEVFPNLNALRQAVQMGRLAASGLIQPFFPIHTPIEGLEPLDEAGARVMTYANSPDRAREIRMHVLASTNAAGALQVETYPTLKYTPPGAEFMKTAGYIALNPACISEGSFIHDKSVALAKTLSLRAGGDGPPIPQWYGAFDWFAAGDIHNPEHVKVGEGNCRGPGLSERSVAAREAFVRVLVASGLRNLGAR